jgi:mono/diheme cytochrome c family protein
LIPHLNKLFYSIVGVVLVALMYLALVGSGAIAQSIFKPDNAAQIATGKQVYSQSCASCNGLNLEGQDNWKSPLPSGRLPAPPHDKEGHTWHHPDQMLFTIIKYGPAAIIGDDYKNDMPGFDGILTDGEIKAVLNYIKSTWPERSRQYQKDMTKQEGAE